MFSVAEKCGKEGPRSTCGIWQFSGFGVLAPVQLGSPDLRSE